jgi:hypothetical protein
VRLSTTGELFWKKQFNSIRGREGFSDCGPAGFERDEEGSGDKQRRCGDKERRFFVAIQNLQGLYQVPVEENPCSTI